jgi:hypothetical protein
MISSQKMFMVVTRVGIDPRVGLGFCRVTPPPLFALSIAQFTTTNLSVATTCCSDESPVEAMEATRGHDELEDARDGYERWMDSERTSQEIYDKAVRLSRVHRAGEHTSKRTRSGSAPAACRPRARPSCPCTCRRRQRRRGGTARCASTSLARATADASGSRVIYAQIIKKMVVTLMPQKVS